MSATAGLSPLQARIARLEQIVSGLQAQAGGGEALSPNYLTVDSQGRVGASFSGSISAQGVDLPSGTSSVLQPTNQIIWEPAAGGGVVASIGAFINAGDDSEIAVNAFPPNVGVATAFSGSSIAAGDQAESIWAKLTAQVETINSIAIDANVSVTAQIPGGPLVQLVLADSGGGSDFAQLPSLAEVFIDGPHVINVPVLPAGGQGFGGNIATTRGAWTQAAVLGTANFAGGGTVWLSGSKYLGGNAFQTTWNASAAGASVATVATMFVIGF
jgi:hypothetical protein